MERLEFLGLRHCSWFEDFVLCDLVKLLLQRDHKAAAYMHRARRADGAAGGAWDTSGGATHHFSESAGDVADRWWMDEGAGDGEEEGEWDEDGGMDAGNREQTRLREREGPSRFQEGREREATADEERGYAGLGVRETRRERAHARYLRLVHGVDCVGSQVSAVGAGQVAGVAKRLGAGSLPVRWRA